MVKKFLVIAAFMLACSQAATASPVVQKSTHFTASGDSACIPEIGSGINYHTMRWQVTGTVSAGTVQLSKYTDSACTTGQSTIISATAATTNGTSSQTSGIANYVSITVASFAGTGSIDVWYGGYIDIGSLNGTGTSGQMAFFDSLGALGGDSDCTFATDTLTCTNLTASPTLGAELMPALTAGNWTVGSGWESPIVGPGLIKNADGTGTQTPSAATSIVAGTIYMAVVTITSRTVGSVTLTLGSVPGGQTMNANQAYTFYIRAANTGNLILTPSSTSRLTVSAVSVTALSSGSITGYGTVKASQIQAASTTGPLIIAPNGSGIAMYMSGQNVYTGGNFPVLLSALTDQSGLNNGLAVSTALGVARIGGGPILNMIRYNGTATAPTAIANADGLGDYNWRGSTGATTASYIGATISAVATENWVSTTNGGSKMVFSTTPTGSQTLTTALTLNSNQSATFAGAVAVTGATTLATSLTGVLRADAGVVSVDSTVPSTVICSNTAASTAITTTASKTYFNKNCTIPANTLSAGKTIKLDLRGIYSGNVTDTIVITIDLCTVSGCGSGTVVNLATTAAFTLSAVSNQGWLINENSVVYTAGASGTLDTQGYGAYQTAALVITFDPTVNTGTATIDTTAAEYLSASVTFSSNNSANSITLRNLQATIQ